MNGRQFQASVVTLSQNPVANIQRERASVPRANLVADVRFGPNLQPPSPNANVTRRQVSTTHLDKSRVKSESEPNDEDDQTMAFLRQWSNNAAPNRENQPRTSRDSVDIFA